MSPVETFGIFMCGLAGYVLLRAWVGVLIAAEKRVRSWFRRRHIVVTRNPDVMFAFSDWLTATYPNEDENLRVRGTVASWPDRPPPPPPMKPREPDLCCLRCRSRNVWLQAQEHQYNCRDCGYATTAAELYRSGSNTVRK